MNGRRPSNPKFIRSEVGKAVPLLNLGELRREFPRKARRRGLMRYAGLRGEIGEVMIVVLKLSPTYIIILSVPLLYIVGAMGY